MVKFSSSKVGPNVSSKLGWSQLATPSIILCFVVCIVSSLAFLDLVFFADNISEASTLQPGNSSQPAPESTPVGPNSWFRVTAPVGDAISAVTVLGAATKVTIALVKYAPAPVKIGAATGTAIFGGCCTVGAAAVHALRRGGDQGPTIIVEAGPSGISVGVTHSSVTESTISKFTSLLDFFSGIDMTLLLHSLQSIVGIFLMAATVLLFWIKSPLLMDSIGTVTRVRIADSNVLGGLIYDHYWFQLYALLTSFCLILFVLSVIYIRFYSVSSSAIVNRVLTDKWADKYTETISSVRIKFDIFLPYVVLVGLLQILLTFWFLLAHPIAIILS